MPQDPNKPSWVQHVMANYTSTYPPEGIFTKSPQEIVDAADIEGVAPKGVVSWQRMVNFHRNRSGRKLKDERRQALTEAIALLSQRIKERKAQPELYEPQTLFPKQAVYGIPDRKEYGDLSKLNAGDLVDFYRQRHFADRAGVHEDIRFGTPETGLYSWASRKGLPTERGVKHLAVQQPLHEHSYGPFQGTIPEGYGKGTVKKVDEGKVLITKIEPGKIHLTLAHRRYPERFVLVKPENMGNDKNWLLMNTTPTEPIPYKKVHYKSVPAKDVEGVLQNLQPGSSVQAKIDGAASLTNVLKDKIEVLSYRQSKVHGGPIIHTERVFHGIPETTVPKEYVGSVLRGELYGTQHGNKSIPPQVLGGLLNSSIAKSLPAQQSNDINLRNMVFDVQQVGKKPVGPEVPYAERLDTVRNILAAIKGKDQGAVQNVLHTPEEAKTPEEALNLYREIRSGKHPRTEEGIVVHPPSGKPMKSKLFQESDVYLRGFFPGQGKYKDRGVGGFVYSHEPKGPIAGEVGTGFTDAMREEFFNAPQEYIGRKARVSHTGKLSSGALFQPSLLALHEDYPLAKGG